MPRNKPTWRHDARVHYEPTGGTLPVCGRTMSDPEFGGMTTTTHPEKVTCPACLEKMAKP